MIFEYHYTKRNHGIYRRENQNETVIVIHSQKCHFPQFSILIKDIMKPTLSDYKHLVLGYLSIFTENIVSKAMMKPL